MRQEVAELPGEHAGPVPGASGPPGWRGQFGVCLTLFLFVRPVRLALRQTTLCRWSWRGSTSCGDSWKKLLEEAWSV